MGGYFANESGCLRRDLAGIAPHSGGTHDLSACPGTIKPVILFHGEVDGVVSYASGLQARDRWLQRNGCSAEFDLELVAGEGSCEYYRDCPEQAQVALCHFGGMEHKWAGGNDPSYWYGDPDRANAAELAWKFWQKYAW
jgi:poly(3-hydroxybutyrate) depolymerase